MTGFRKRKSVMLDTSTVNSIHSQIDRTTTHRFSLQSDIRSPISLKSSKSSWSASPSVTKKSFEQLLPIDPEALQRTMESKELLDLRSTQLKERDRFLQYQRDVLAQLRSEHIAAKSNLIKEHQRVVDETTQKVRSHLNYA